ncbi:hypothetical protein ANANG_G00065450 [Anguilla anguilla]|uniref:Uncharacterized protein n=1 Tax=Anguilla anguilla TaxID=7936 RepID=A0A9D3MPN4_ANGAN|nr:hypothetical protein ANANG_G00065450 [Anguilla anguilla]
MTWILTRLLFFILIFNFSDTPQFGNITGDVSSVCRGDGQNCSCPSFGNNLGNLVNKPGFGTGPWDPNRLSEIYSETFVEASFTPGLRVLKPLSADGLIDSAPADDSAWPSFAALRHFFHQTLERFHAYVGELVNKPGFRTGPGDPNMPSEIHSEAFVEASFTPGLRVPKPLSADGLIDSAPADDSAWPSFAALRHFFHQTLERFHAYVGELVNKPGFRTGPGDPNMPSEIHSEAFVEASFTPGLRVPKALSADGLIDSAPADDSAWPSFAALRHFFHQTLERFHAYVGELVNKPGFRTGPGDSNRPSEIHSEAFVELIGSLPEEVQPNTTLHEWNCRILTIIATVEAVLIIGTVFVLRCMVKSTFIHTEEEKDLVNKKLLKEQKQTQAVEGKVMVLLRELKVYEREWAYQEILFKEIKNNLKIIDRKYKEREASLFQKQVKKHEDAKRMRAREGLKDCKDKKEEKNETSLLKVTFQDEFLSCQIKEAENIRSLLDEVNMGLAKMRGPIFDCSAGCSDSQFPSPGTDTCSTQTLCSDSSELS